MCRWMILAAALCVAAPRCPAGELRLTVEEPAAVARQQWPVTSGVPLAQGDLRDDQAAMLVDQAGREMPLQTETLARWPDGSVRWLLADFQIDLAAKEKKTLTLRYGPAVHRAAVDRPVRMTKQADGSVVVEPGPVRLEYGTEDDKAVFFPQGDAWLLGKGGDKKNRLTFNCGADGVKLRTEPNGHFRPEIGAMVIEQSGPVRACLRVSGSHVDGKAKKMFRYVARIHAWRGQPYVRVFYTFINDRQDAVMGDVESLSAYFWVPRGGPSCLLDGTSVTQGRLFQMDESHYQGDQKQAGRRLSGWAAVGSEKGGLAVGLRDFWQNWPKAIRADAGGNSCITVELCPKLPAGLYDGKPLEEENKLYYALRGGQYTFKVGVAKTHELWIRYLDGKPEAKRLGEFFQGMNEPLMAVAEPAYVSATKALGEFPPADPKKYAGYDDWFSKALDKHLVRRERDREFGLLNYGDWYGERKVNWGNLEYDLAHGMLLQYLRTGDRRYFLRGEQAARHHVDVDVVHAVNPLLKNPYGPPPQVGDIWVHCLNHTGGYYDNAALPVAKTYQMGYSKNFGHVWVGGDFEYYFLTGDRRVRDVAIEIADSMASQCPTAYGDHIRGLGWPMVLTLNAYEATGDKKYLEAATSCWQVLKKNIDWQRGWVVRLAKGHCLHPERTCYGNVPFMEGLTVSALARYHRITQDPEALRAMTVAIDQMIRECWIEEDRAFRYTACPLSSPKTYNSICLAAEGMAYECRLTGNREHLRILKAGLSETLARAGSGDGKGTAQLIHFIPYALQVLEEDKPKR